MEFSLRDCKQLCTATEYTWVKLARGGRLSALSGRELEQAIREVRELRKKYRDLHDRQQGRRKRGGRPDTVWEMASDLPSRTEQKQMIFADAQERLQHEQDARLEAAEGPVTRGLLRHGDGPPIGRIRLREDRSDDSPRT